MAGRPQSARPLKLSNFHARVGPAKLPRDNLGAAAYVRVSTQDTREALRQITKQINAVIQRAKNDSETVLQLALMPIFEESLRLCPEDTGDLRESAKLETSKQGDKVRAEISYGDALAWYAALVHEIMWYHHEPPTQAKYLQQAMEEGLEDLPLRLKALYQELLGLDRR